MKKNKIVAHNLAGDHFVDLLNDISLSVPSGNLKDKDKLRIQVLLLHIYLDYLMTLIVDKISPSRKKKLKYLGKARIKTTYGRLKLLRLRRTLDSNAYNVLVYLNDIRNLIAHEYNFKISNIEELVNKMKSKIDRGLLAQFNDSNIEGRISLACVPYINSLREYILKRSGKGVGTPIRVVIEKGVVKYMWLGNQ